MVVKKKKQKFKKKMLLKESYIKRSDIKFMNSQVVYEIKLSPVQFFIFERSFLLKQMG